MTVKKGFAVTVEGLYMVDATVGRVRQAEKKNYKVVVNVPKYGEDTLSLIKNRLLESAIRAFDPNYKTYLTHSITDVKALGDTKDVALSGKYLTVHSMSVTQLVKYVQGQKLPVAIHLYTEDILEFRKAIDSCKADKKKFLGKQKKLQEDYEVQKELQELNPELQTKGEVKIKHSSSEAVSSTSPPVASEKLDTQLNDDVVAAALIEAEAVEKKVEETVDPEDEEFLTDGSESFDRESEAPYADNIDEEAVQEESAENEADILAGNVETKKDDLVSDL